MLLLSQACYPGAFMEKQMTWTQTLVVAAALLTAGIGLANAQSNSNNDFKIAPISGQGSLVWILGSDGQLWFCGAKGDLEIDCGNSHQLQ
jgi:hypothetical protein